MSRSHVCNGAVPGIEVIHTASSTTCCSTSTTSSRSCTSSTRRSRACESAQQDQSSSTRAQGSSSRAGHPALRTLFPTVQTRSQTVPYSRTSLNAALRFSPANKLRPAMAGTRVMRWFRPPPLPLHGSPSEVTFVQPGPEDGVSPLPVRCLSPRVLAIGMAEGSLF